MLAITGGKGGCGKTMTTLGLAGALARSGSHPLVVDGDCDMPDVHHETRIERAGGVDAVADGDSLQDAVQYSARVPGVALLTAGRRHNLSGVLARARQWRGPVVVDCAAGGHADALRPVRHASHALVVSTDGTQCLEDANRTLAAVCEVGTEPVGVIIRTTDSWTGVEPPVQAPVLASVPSVDRPLSNRSVRRRLESVSQLIVNRDSPEQIAVPSVR